jgi:hypothetical protein
MHILGKLTAALLLVTAVGCVAEEEGRPEDDATLDWRSGGKGDGQTCEFDQQSAATYLNNFLYRDVGAETGGGHRYRIGFTFDKQAILPNGDAAAFTMYLLPAGRAIVDYHEEKRVDSSRSEVVNQTVIVTRYSIDATTRAFKLDGFGTGTPLTATDGGRCAAAFNFTFTGDVRTAGLSGGKAVAYAGTSSGFVIDPDHLEDVPYESTRTWFREDVASGKIVVVHK